MKSKTNFTYKQFIEKISNLPTDNNQNQNAKSPRFLKNTGQNCTPSNKDHSKFFFKHNLKKSLNQKDTTKYSPKKTFTNENYINKSKEKCSKDCTKNTTNQKLTPRNQNILGSSKVNNSNKHLISMNLETPRNNSQKEYNNQKSRHLQSCTSFSKNWNQKQNYFKQTQNNKSQITLKLKTKNNNGNESKNNKRMTQGNLTQRQHERLNTHYDRTNTQLSKAGHQTFRVNTQYDRSSPSFYQRSMNDSNSEDFDDLNNFSKQKRNLSKNKSQSSLKMNKKSYELAYNKFICQISDILLKITNIQDQNQLLQHRIKYIEYLESLKSLKMIRNDYQPYSQVECIDLVRQLWEQLIMNHNINHFIIIISIILKITPLDQIKQQNKKQYQNYLYLQKKYENFRFTRLELNKPKTFSEKQSIDYYNYPFKPEISKRSQNLDEKSKSKRKYKLNVKQQHNSSVNGFYHKSNLSVNTQFDHNLSQNQSILSPQMKLTSPLGIKRSEILYKQAKKKSLQKKQNKSTIDYQYERNIQQLTFKPKLKIKRKVKHNESNQYFSPRFTIDEQKCINRMIRGRVERQVRQLAISKGLPYNEKTIEKMKQQKFDEFIKDTIQSRSQSNKVKLKLSKRSKQAPPLQDLLNLSFQSTPTYFPQPQLQDANDYIILDIYIEEDSIEKLILKRGANTQDIHKAAQQFVNRHNLSSEMANRLIQRLTDTLTNNLQQIEQNSDEQNCSLLI